jgi:FkbM family methyltransferase
MKSIRFELNGQHELVIPDGGSYHEAAESIIRGYSYPFPQGEKPKVVVDIGAHVGEFTVCAAALWPEARIYAYEPYPPSYELLCRNCLPYKKITCIQKAVAEKAGKAKLHLSSMNAMCHSLMVRDTFGGQMMDVDCISGHNLPKNIDILKIDAEGAEVGILSCLHLPDIYRVYVEFHYEHDRIRICNRLDATHSLTHARIGQSNQGEMMYVRRD